MAEVRAAKASPRVAANFIVVLWGELFFPFGGSTGQGNCGCHVLNDNEEAFYLTLTTPPLL